MFTFNYYQQKKNFIYDLSNIEKVTKVSDYEVEFVINEPSAVVLEKVFMSTPIIPEHIGKDVEDPQKLHVDKPQNAVIGTGPYILADYQKEHVPIISWHMMGFGAERRGLSK